MSRHRVHGKVAVTPDQSAASESTTAFQLFASADIAADVGDLSAFTAASETQLLVFIETCVATTAKKLLALGNSASSLPIESSSTEILTLPASAEAIFSGTGSHEMAVRLLSSDEMSVLNRNYRGKDGPTNVLSFAALDEVDSVSDANLPGISDLFVGVDMTAEGYQEHSEWSVHLGDIAICTDVVVNEARLQGKEAKAHLAHMVVHGLLHLLGYDHLSEQEAGIMEATEAFVLAELGYTDPYNAVQHEVSKKNS